MLSVLRWCRRVVRRGWRSAMRQVRPLLRTSAPAPAYVAAAQRRITVPALAPAPAPRERRARPQPAPRRVSDAEYIAAIKATIDLARWQALRDEWTAEGRHKFSRGYLKYFDLERWFPQAVSLARQTGLMEPGRKRVLDIGCGSGLFGYVCRHLGHDFTGLDLDNPMFVAMREVLGVPWVSEQVERGRPLPVQLTGFDVVTTISPKFHLAEIIDGKWVPFVWSGEDWEAFLSDVRTRLNPDGIYLFRFSKSEFLPPRLHELTAQARPLQPGTFVFTRHDLPG